MIASYRRTALASAGLLALAACSPATPPAPPPAPVAKKAPPAAKPPVAAPTAQATAAVPASTAPIGQAINISALTANAQPDDLRNQLVKAEVLLDRAHFSPGVIDGRDGGNLKQAISAYETANNLPVDGNLDPAVWNALTGADSGPAMTDYVITADDVQGPFIGKVPGKMTAQAKLPHMGFTSPLQLLGQKFHMDQALLTALNPGADFAVAGTRIVVAAPSTDELGDQVTAIQVDKSKQQVRAYDAAGKLAAVYPATVGSQERPAPTGTWAVRAVAPRPNYTFNPARLTFGKSKTVFTIQPGPNNPVGTTWIALTKETYGIHGTPDPTMVGKVASHGCVRLTNWDANQLGKAVKKGSPVIFVGEETHKKTSA
jgi:lipoprotein-anchoring transpeptidase ErfK/SrfK